MLDRKALLMKWLFEMAFGDLEVDQINEPDMAFLRGNCSSLIELGKSNDIQLSVASRLRAIGPLSSSDQK